MKKLILLLISALTALRAQHTITIIPDATAAGKLVFRELNANGLQSVTLEAPPTLAGNVRLILPDTVGLAGDCLMNGATPGTLTLSTCGAGGLPVSDAIPIVHPAADATALMRFDATAIATASTVVLTIPNTSMILAGSDVDNFFTANQTTRDILCYVDNGCNIGTSPIRFNTLATHNVDSAPAGDSTAYTMVNHLAITDHLNGGAGIGTPSAFYDILVNAAGSGASGMTIRDNAGAEVFVLWRSTGAITFNEARLDMNLVPSQASISGVQSNFSLGTQNKQWNQLYINGLNVNTVFTNLIPTGGSLNLGNSSNRWNTGFFTSINCLGGTGCPVDLLPLNNLWTGTNTFHDILCYVDNGCNIGTSPIRFNTLATHNVDSAPAGDSTAYTMVNHLAITDHVNGGAGIGTPSAFWDMIANAGGGVSSGLFIRDNAGTTTLELRRQEASFVVNEARFDVDIVPSVSSLSGVQSHWSLGIAGKKWNQLYVSGLNVNTVFTDLIPTGTLNVGNSSNRWNGFFQDINISGTCTGVGCGTNFLPLNNTWTGTNTWTQDLTAFSSGNVQFVKVNKLVFNFGTTASNFQWVMSATNVARLLDNSGSPIMQFDTSVSPASTTLASNLLPGASNTYSLGSSTANRYLKLWTDQIEITNVNGLIPSTTDILDLGSASRAWRTIYATYWSGSFYPLTTGAQSIGNPAHLWQQAYIGSVFATNLTLTGTCTGCGTSPLASNNLWTGTNQFYNNLFEVEADGGGSAFVFSSSYGTGFAGFVGRAAGGSFASPSAAVLDQQLAALGGRGRTGAGAGSWSTGNTATIAFLAAENWAGGGNGSYILLGTTPVGSTSRSTKLRIGSAFDYQTLLTTGGMFASLGFTSDQAFYPRQFGSCGSLNSSNSTYGGLGYQSGSTYCYWNASTLSWAAVNFAAGGVTSVSGGSPIASTGGATPTITCGTCLTTTTSAPTITGSSWTFSNAIKATTGVDTTGSFSTLNGAITTSILSSGGLSIYNPTSGAFIAGISAFTGAFTGPSGSPGTSTLLSCSAGLAIKTLNISGGIVISATCGVP